MKLREILVRSFIDALQRSATPSNIKAGFSATGMCPCDPNVPLSSQFVAIPPDPSVFMTSPTGTEVGNMCLTSKEGFGFLCSVIKGRLPIPEDSRLLLSTIIPKLFENSVDAGRAISPLPPAVYFDDLHHWSTIDLSYHQ
jgi:hypothetical protein